MADVRGFREEAARRIWAATQKTERQTGTLEASTGGPVKPQRWVRLLLDGSLSSTVATTGRITVPKSDHTGFVDSGLTIGNIFQGADGLVASAGQAVWATNLAGNWYALELARDGSSNPSAGCCAECIKAKYLIEGGGAYSDTYYISGIPSELGGVDGEVSLALISDGVWESDTFLFTCDAGADSYYWRYIATNVSPDSYPAAKGSVRGCGSCTTHVSGMIGACDADETGVLYLVHTGSSSVCDRLDYQENDHYTTDNGHGVPEFLPYIYRNGRPVDFQCGTPFELYPRSCLPEPLRDLLPCTVCVYPKDPRSHGKAGTGRIDKADLSTCWQDYCTTHGCDSLPATVWLTLEDWTIFTDGSGNPYVDITADQFAFQLDSSGGNYFHSGGTSSKCPCWAANGAQCTISAYKLFALHGNSSTDIWLSPMVGCSGSDFVLGLAVGSNSLLSQFVMSHDVGASPAFPDANAYTAPYGTVTSYCNLTGNFTTTLYSSNSLCTNVTAYASLTWKVEAD